MVVIFYSISVIRNKSLYRVQTTCSIDGIIHRPGVSRNQIFWYLAARDTCVFISLAEGRVSTNLNIDFYTACTKLFDFKLEKIAELDKLKTGV